MKFTVIDCETRTEPDLERIARTEAWAKDLMADDIEGFAVGEDGTVYLLDECGNYAYAPPGRFAVECQEGKA